MLHPSQAGTSTALLVFFLVCAAAFGYPQYQGPRWVYVGTNVEGYRFHYDKNSLEHPRAGVVEVWVRTTSPEGESHMIQVRVDCGRGRVTWLNSEKKDDEAVPPGSVLQTLVRKLCK
ncbi:MAG TPA: hypothetical protein VNO81_05095 [Candidatus Nitrosotenuis sp.]|jgi:hypothetical protein|nr:hypothetical protein [Candidatus Nitrosotenuis sp.]